MANDKYYGYRPKTEKNSLGVPWGNDPRLENCNPYEFKKGMDWELAKMGCPRLHEATEDERTKATTTILKNLKESDAYYSYQMAYETKYQNHQGKKPSFKTYLKEIDGYKMQEVGKEYKNDKMEKVKLKEALKKEIKFVLSEGKFLGLKEIEPLSEKKKDDKKSDTEKAESNAKSDDVGKSASEVNTSYEKTIKQKEDLVRKRDKLFRTYKEKVKNESNPEKIKKELGNYTEKAKPLQKEIDNKDVELKKLKVVEAEALGTAKELRREAAKTMMEKDVHLEILNIIKEAGVNLSEGAQGVKMYYEIAKTSYMEGLMAGYSGE